MRIGIYTLGCKVNQFESQAIGEALEEKGHAVVGVHEPLELFLINTCAVTRKACSQARQTIRRVLRGSPGARVIATGCYAQIDPMALTDAVDAPISIIGNDQKEMLLSHDLASLDCPGIYRGDIFRKTVISDFSLKRPQGRTRALLRIQDGCNSFCTYCIVPYARGPSRSLPPERVIEQASRYRDAGVKEIVVTGIHIGLYGKDLKGGWNLLGILGELTKRFPECRFRLSSIGPDELTNGILDLCVRRPNFCEHFHIALQSGSQRILKAMGRHYSPDLFLERVLAIKRRLPLAAIGTDCLVGFPGEKEDDFNKTRALIKKAPISYVHAFPFSMRPGTRAAALKETVTRREKKRRCRVIREIGALKRVAFYKGAIGRAMECVIERVDSAQGKAIGRTSNYLLVEVAFDPLKRLISPNQVVTVRPSVYEEDILKGGIIA